MAKVDAKKVRARLCARGGAVDREVARVADEIRQQARKLWAEKVQLPQFETRDYRSNFRTERDRGMECAWRASNVDPKANWLEYGTGIYGPHGTPIVPTNADNLVFFWDRHQTWVTTPSVKGRPATPTLTEAAENVARKYGYRYTPTPGASTARRP